MIYQFRTKKFFEANDGAAIYAIGIGALMILQFAVAFVIIGMGNIGEAFQIFASLLFQGGYLGAFYFYSSYKKVKPTYYIKTKISPVWIAVGLLAAPFCLFCFYGVAALFDSFLRNIGYDIGGAFESGGLLQNALIIFVTVIAAPVGEELIFRSGLLSGLKKNFNDLVSAIICGLAFSFMHMNPQQTVYQFFLGFAAAYLVLSSESVIPAILLHAANNLIAVMATFFPFVEKIFIGYESAFLSNQSMAVITSVVFCAAGVAIIILGASFLKKFEKKYKRKNGYVPMDEMVTVLPYGGTKKGGAIYYLLLILPLAVTAFMWIFNFAAVILMSNI